MDQSQFARMSYGEREQYDGKQFAQQFAVDQQRQIQRAVAQQAGVGYGQGVVGATLAAPPRESLCTLSNENLKSACGLLSRISTAADVLGGPIPQGEDKATVANPQSLLEVQRDIQRTLRLCVEHMLRLENATH